MSRNTPATTAQTLESLTETVASMVAVQAEMQATLERLVPIIGTLVSDRAKVTRTAKVAPEPEPTSARCTAKTSTGKRCKRLTKTGLCSTHMDLDAPTPKASKASKAPKAKAAPKATKGERTDLTRRDWNKTVTTKARLAGGDTYKRVIAAWADVKAAHAEGLTPDQVIARFTK